MKKKKASDWFEEIDKGLEYRKLYGLEEEWRDLEGMFYGIAGDITDYSSNVILSTGDSLVSSLTVPSPRVLITPLTKRSMTTCGLVERVANRLVRSTGLVREMEKAVLHAYLWGVGILKIGYDSEWGWDEDVDTWGEGEEMGMSLSQFNQKGERIEFRSRVKPGMPWVKAVMPHDIVVPWGTGSLEDAPWVAHRVVRHVDDLKKDRKYKNTKNLEPTISMEDFVKSYETINGKVRGVGGEGESEFCELWEIHDRRTQKVITITEDKILREVDDFLQLDGLPFVAFSFVPQTRSFWCSSDAHMLKPVQKDIADIAIQSAKQRKLSILKFMYKKGAMSREALNDLFNTTVGAGVEVNAGEDIDKLIRPLTPANNNMTLQNEGEYRRRDAREAVGFSRNQAGEFEASGRRTATEAMTVQKGAELRLGRRKKIVKRCYGDTIRKFVRIVMEYWKAPRVMETEGVEGKKWESFTGEDIKGSYDFDVSFVYENEEDLGGRKQEALQTYIQALKDPSLDQNAALENLCRVFNEPAMEGVFSNAGLQVQMQKMQGGVGGVQKGSQPGGGRMPQVPGQGGDSPLGLPG